MKKTTQVATMAIIVAAAIVAGMLAYPLIISASANSANGVPSATQTPARAGTSHWNFQSSPNFSFRGNPMNSWSGPMRGGPGYSRAQVNLTVGQTITITSTHGMFRAIGSTANGTASGTLTFSVSGKLSQGYVLSITGGSVEVAGTTYTVSSGSAQMGRSATSISGQGATTPTGLFLLQAQARGSFAGSSTAFVSLDLSAGNTEYAVTLTGTIQG